MHHIELKLGLAGAEDRKPPLVMLPGYGLGAGGFFLVLEAFVALAKEKGGAESLPFDTVYALDWPGSGLSSRFDAPKAAAAAASAPADGEAAGGEAVVGDGEALSLNKLLKFACDSIDEWRLAVVGLSGEVPSGGNVVGKPFALLGHSLGGYLAFCYAEEYDRRTQSRRNSPGNSRPNSSSSSSSESRHGKKKKQQQEQEQGLSHLLLVSPFGLGCHPAMRKAGFLKVSSETEWLERKTSDLKAGRRARTDFDRGQGDRGGQRKCCCCSNLRRLQCALGLLGCCAPCFFVGQCCARQASCGAKRNNRGSGSGVVAVQRRQLQPRKQSSSQEVEEVSGGEEDRFKRRTTEGKEDEKDNQQLASPISRLVDRVSCGWLRRLGVMWYASFRFKDNGQWKEDDDDHDNANGCTINSSSSSHSRCRCRCSNRSKRANLAAYLHASSSHDACEGFGEYLYDRAVLPFSFGTFWPRHQALIGGDCVEVPFVNGEQEWPPPPSPLKQDLEVIPPGSSSPASSSSLSESASTSSASPASLHSLSSPPVDTPSSSSTPPPERPYSNGRIQDYIRRRAENIQESPFSLSFIYGELDWVDPRLAVDVSREFTSSSQSSSNNDNKNKNVNGNGGGINRSNKSEGDEEAHPETLLPPPVVIVNGSSGGRVLRVLNAGHQIMVDNPRAFAQAIVDSFASPSPSPVSVYNK
jgi:pimeloyl-ACP methyl ester carboxylesterase